MPRHKKKRSATQDLPVPSVAARHWLLGPAGWLLILLTTFVVYLPAMHGGRLKDDNANITKPELRSLSGLYRIWFDPTATAQYYPLDHTAFWLEHRLWGDAVAGYHLVNVLWHLVAVTLLYFVVQKLKVPGALLAAAVFALHPVMVESVAYISEQKNTLSTVFYLSAMLLYLSFDESRRRSHYFIALGLFALALLTKTVTVTLPVALLVIFWWQRGALTWQRDVWPLIPFFALSAAAGAMTIWVEQSYFHGGDTDYALTIVQRFLLAGRALWFYLGKLLWPADILFVYRRWTMDPAQWWQWIFPIAAIATTFVLWAIRKRWRAPLAGWLFFCGTLFPALGFVNVFMFTITFVADHIQYLASLGIIVVICGGIALAMGKASLRARRAGAVLCILLVGTLATLTWQQARLYGDALAPYQAMLDRDPDSWLAHNDIGLALHAKGDLQDAIEHLQAAIRIRPGYADAHNNLGSTFTDAGQFQLALDQLHEALRLNPNHVEARVNLGNALICTGRPQEAIAEFQIALARRPNDPFILTNLGLALTNAGRLQEAVDVLQAALAVYPSNTFARNDLIAALTQLGRPAEAIKQLRQALELAPNDADVHYNLAVHLAGMGDITEAIVHFKTAIRLRPDFVAAYANVAQALARQARPQEAITSAKKGIEVARSTGQEAAAEQIEEWLKHYETELQRSGDPKINSQQ